MQIAAGKTPSTEKAVGGRHEVGGTMELYLTCPKSRLVWAFDVRLIVRFDRFVVQERKCSFGGCRLRSARPLGGTPQCKLPWSHRIL